MTTFFQSILCVLLRYNWLVKCKIKYIHTQRAIFKNIKLHQGSHSHITVDILQWKELPEVIQSNLLLKARPLGSGPCPSKFCAISKNEDFSTSLDNILLCLTALTGKIFSLVSNQNFPRSNMCLLPLMLSLCNLQGKPGSVFSTPSHQLAANCHEIPLSLLFSRVNKLSSLSLSSHFTCSSLQPSWWTSLDSLQYVNVFLVLAGPKLDIVLQMWSHTCQAEGKDQFFQPAGHACSF